MLQTLKCSTCEQSEKHQRLALKLFNAFPFKRWVSKFEDWTQHQFHSACTGIYVVPRKSFLDVARLTASNSYAHEILWMISFPLSSSSDYKNKTCKPLQLASWHFSQQIMEREWKHMFVQCALSISAIQQVYLIYGDIISWKNMATAVVSSHFLESKYWVGNLIRIALSFLS